MNTKLVPVVSAILVAGILFAGFVIIDSSNNKDNIAPIPNQKSELLGATSKTNSVSKDLAIPKNPDKAFTHIKDLASSKSGDYGIYIKDLNSGEKYLYNENQNFYAASLYKVAVAIATYNEIERGLISLDQVVEFKESDKAFGSGTIADSDLGKNYTIEELLSLLLKESDNVAQNMILRIISRNAIARAFPAAVTDAVFPIKINSSASRMGSILENLYYNRHLNLENTKALMETMSETSFDDRIHNGLDSSVIFSHKIGNWETRGAWHDCGIATLDRPIIVCVMSEGASYEEFLEVTKSVGLMVSSMFTQ